MPTIMNSDLIMIDFALFSIFNICCLKLNTINHGFN